MSSALTRSELHRPLCLNAGLLFYFYHYHLICPWDVFLQFRLFTASLGTEVYHWQLTISLESKKIIRLKSLFTFTLFLFLKLTADTENISVVSAHLNLSSTNKLNLQFTFSARVNRLWRKVYLFVVQGFRYWIKSTNKLTLLSMCCKSFHLDVLQFSK